MKIDYNQFMNRLFFKAGAQGIPLAGTFEITSRCNLDCRMCYIHRRANDAAAIKSEKNAQWWKSLADAAKSAGMLTLLITGGEPLLRPDFEEIYLHCQSQGLLLQVNTNATLINEEKVRFFAAHKPQRLNITLYGASRETYGTLCGKPEAYDCVMWALGALKAAGVTVKLNYSATPYNCADALAIYRYARENEFELQTATYMFAPVRACEHGCFETQRLSAEAAAVEQLKYTRFRMGDEGFREYVRKFREGHPEPMPDDECQDLPAEKIRCRAGQTTFWVTCDGQMRPCGMMTEPSTAVEEFFSAWAEIHEAREGILMPAKCMNCDLRKLCDVCAAVTYAENGRFDAVPQYACEKTKAYWRLCEKYMEA